MIVWHRGIRHIRRLRSTALEMRRDQRAVEFLTLRMSMRECEATETATGRVQDACSTGHARVERESTMVVSGDGVVLEASSCTSRSDIDSAGTELLVPSRWIAAALSGIGSSAAKTSAASSNGHASSLPKEKWTGMRLVDTVMLDGAGDVESWVFTAKTGHVTSKKRAKDRAKIAERFERFALANPRNKEEFVALLVCGRPRGREVERRIVLNKKALRDAILVESSQQVPRELQGASLHCYLRPRNGSNSFLRGCYNHESSGRFSFCLSKISPLYELPRLEGSFTADGGEATPNNEERILDDDPESTRLRIEAERALTSLVEFLKQQLASKGVAEDSSPTIQKCKADFIIDDNGELWLTSLPTLTITHASGVMFEAVTSPGLSIATSGETRGSRDEGGFDESGSSRKTASEAALHMPPLLGGATSAPKVAAPLDGSGSTPLESVRQGSARSNGQSSSTSPITVGSSIHLQLGGLTERELPAIPPTMLGARSSPGDHNSNFRVNSGQRGGGAIFEKKGGAYVANVHASALRGLCCWRESPAGRRGSGSRGRDSSRWHLVEGRYKGNLSSEGRREAQEEDRRSGETALDCESSPSSFDGLSKARFKMTARSVLLALATASFLRGDEPWHAGGDARKSSKGESRSGEKATSLAQRWRECDQRAQLSLASANPQAYYDEVTVCGNCLEICRKLDSIRASGFPDAIGAAATGGAAGAGADAAFENGGGAGTLSDARPRSEPLPEFTPAAASLSEGERRPGTAASGSLIGLATAAVGDAAYAREASDGGAAADVLESTRIVHGGLGEQEGGGGQGGSGGAGPSPVGLNGSTLESPVANVSGGDVRVGPESNNAGRSIAGEIEAPAVTSASTFCTIDSKKGGSAKAAIDRLSGVYLGDPRTGAGKPSRTRVTSSKAGGVGELPNVAMVARFAIERDRLAREIGVDELGGPATLGVVNVGAGATGNGRQQQSQRYPGGKGDGGGGGNKRARNHHQRSRGRGVGLGKGGETGHSSALSPSAAKVAAEKKSAGELLLEKLESVAEARSIESAAGFRSCGGGDQADVQADGGEPPRDDWRAEEEEPWLSDDPGEPARWNGAGTRGGGGTGSGVGTVWGGGPPIAGELSTTESAFLERSRGIDRRGGGGGGVLGARVGGDSLFGQHFEAGFRDEGSDAGGGGGSGGAHLATIGALRDRLAALEGENSALRARARRAEEERAAEAARGDRASRKLAQARTEFARAMSEKDEDYRRRELELQEMHSQELAKNSQASAEEMMMASLGVEEGAKVQGGDGRDAEGSGAGGRKSSKGLIARLDQALQEMAEQQRRFLQAKRTLLAEKTMEVAAAETKGRRELQEARTLAAAMEDKVAALQEQVAEAAKQISALKTREEEQKKRRLSAEEDADKIRKDISVLRQTVQASQSMDITDESGGRRDAQSTLAALTATSEARIRTLNNKVEFLKAQLASEQTLKAEVEAALALAQRSVFEAKDEAKKQAAESDKAREVAVEEAVTSANRQVEESMSENYRIQSKVQTLQDQLNDALGDLAMARRREAALKAEVAVAAAKLEDRGAELAKAQSRADDLAEARAADTESSADRAAREAVVRRLDNERQYLKSQLQSEITCKDELREALATATRQLGDIKVDWAEEQAKRTDEFQRELQAKTQAMSDLSAEKVAMEAEVVAVARQLGLLKDGYSKARENLRAEQSALETARTANRRLREEITATTEELAAIKTQQVEDARRHSQSLVAARTALDEADEARRKQGVDQQMQLRQQILKTSEVQRQLMTLQGELTERERAAERLLAAERLAQGLARWCTNRKASAFYSIVTGVAMVTAENDVRERTRRALREAGEGARRSQKAAVEEAQTIAMNEAKQELAEAERRFSEERDRLLEDAEAAAAVAATHVQTIEELRALEAGTRRELEKARAEVKETARRHRDNAVRAAQEAEARAKERIEAAVSSTREACEETSAKAKEKSDENWREVLREHLKKAGEEAAEMAAAADREHDAVLEETQQAFRMERARLREETERLVAAAEEAERQRGLELCAEARSAGEAAAAAAADLARDRERAEADQRQAEALAEAAERAAEAAALARTLEKEERRRAEEEAAGQSARLQEELARAKERAVTLEGGKWRRASEEAEARAAAEQAAAYERGTVDRGRQAEAEALQLQDAAEKALEEVKEGARTTIAEMAARHLEELEAERRRISEDEKVAREAALEAAREECSQQQSKAVANARAAATAEARARAERDRAAAIEAAKERERLATERVQEELRSAKTEWSAERRRLKEQTAMLEAAEQKAKDDLLRAMATSSQATQRARARWEEGQKSAMEKAAAEAVEEREKALEDARRAFNREKKRALMEAQDAFAAQAEAMTDMLRKEAAASLQKAEGSFADAQAENGRLAADLEKCQKELEECQSSLLHSEADLKEQSVSHSIDAWRMAVAAINLRLGNEKAVKQLREEAAERAAEAESNFEAQKEALSAVVEELLELSFDSRRRFAAMQETLVNHKREVLIDHKVQSSSLHKELDGLARDRDQLEEQRMVLQREFRELEGQAKDAEKEAHAHSRQSAIGPDGMIIPARARKKRRLDEELEALLEAMESKRKALTALDGKLSCLAETRAVKDEEMKGLERTLVQVLVEQQKKLLALLGEVGEQAGQLEEIDERTRFARDEAKRRKAQAQRQQQDGGAGG